MDIETSNAIKLFFPNPSLVQVFFEALANALDAGGSEISIHVEIRSFTAPETLKISITDNGHGFTDESFERFRRLLKPPDSFHKGLGRLVYLNYFGRIAVESTWSTTPHVDVVIVEIKKKTDDEKENIFAINQLLDRAQKLVNHCPNIQRVWYYAILQINDVLAARLRQMKWAPLFSTGKVFYQDFETRRPDGVIVPTPTFVLSFDAIIGDAESRNHTFLEILKSGIKSLANAGSSDSEPSSTPAATFASNS